MVHFAAMDACAKLSRSCRPSVGVPTQVFGAMKKSVSWVVPVAAIGSAFFTAATLLQYMQAHRAAQSGGHPQSWWARLLSVR
jgi:hypothetical protein